jgi:hypothetical protein
VTGLKEQVKGKVSHNPELAARGHDRMTGELKHKELEEDAVSEFNWNSYLFLTS